MKKFIKKAKVMFCCAKVALSDKRAEGFVDTGVKVLMSVVIGALVLGGLYMLFDNNILPVLTDKINTLFEYAG